MEDVDTPTEPRSTQIRAVVDASRRLIARYVTHFLDRNDTFPDAETRESIQGKIEGILPHIASARDMLLRIAS